MKKNILVAFLAISALGITSCNKDVEPMKFTDQSTLAFGVSNLMTKGLFEIFAYEEYISTKIAKGETLEQTVEILKNTAGDTVGWKSGFRSEDTFLKDSITVTFDGSLLDNDVVKTIDCSKIAISKSTLKFFGTINVTNNSTSDTETSRTVETNMFGWGEESNDLSLNAIYTFDIQYSNGLINDWKITGGALSGNHSEYGLFSQIVTNELTAGVYRLASDDYNYYYFASGSMVLTAPLFGGSASPISVVFAQDTKTVTYLEESITYPFYY
ncbi:MAG: hypothetical protein LBJ63_03190 [Prevotellaceae bacterium]|nr:hypothetical protein [Prevotellaceae bacterium]